MHKEQFHLNCQSLIHPQCSLLYDWPLKLNKVDQTFINLLFNYFSYNDLKCHVIHIFTRHCCVMIPSEIGSRRRVTKMRFVNIAKKTSILQMDEKRL